MDWNDWLKLLVPLIAGSIGWLIGWKLKERSEALKLAKESIRQQRREAYTEVLEPLVSMMTGAGVKDKDKDGNLQVDTQAYRRKAFQLMLFGDDDVIRQWNALWQSLYKNMATIQTDAPAYLLQIGRLMLAIRKSLGHADTTLNEVDVYAWLVRDIEKLEAVRQQLAKSKNKPKPTQ